MQLYRWTWGTGGVDERVGVWKRSFRCFIISCIVDSYGKRCKNSETLSYSWRLAENSLIIEWNFTSWVFRNCSRKAVEVAPKILFSFGCHIPEWKNMFNVKHGAAKCSFIRCLSVVQEISDVTFGMRQTAHDKDVLSRSFESNYNWCKGVLNQGKRRNAHAKLKQVKSDIIRYTMNRSDKILFTIELTITLWQNNRFSDFTIRPLHLLHFAVFKKLKEYTVMFLSKANWMEVSTVGNKKRRKASSCKAFLLNGYNSLLTAYQHENDLLGLRADFSKAENSS